MPVGEFEVERFGCFFNAKLEENDIGQQLRGVLQRCVEAGKAAGARDVGVGIDNAGAPFGSCNAGRNETGIVGWRPEKDAADIDTGLSRYLEGTGCIKRRCRTGIDVRLNRCLRY